MLSMLIKVNSSPQKLKNIKPTIFLRASAAKYQKMWEWGSLKINISLKKILSGLQIQNFNFLSCRDIANSEWERIGNEWVKCSERANST